MTPKLVMSLGLAAIISTGAAVVAWQAQNTESSVAGAGDRLLPKLVEGVNAVAEIEVVEAEKRMHLKRAAEGWQVLPSDYPVKPRKLQETLVGMVRLTKLEPRTASPDKYPVIQVEDAGAAGSQSRQVTLKNEAGEVVGDVLFGKAAAGYTTGAEEAQYVRLAGDAQSWLVRGSVAAGAEYKDWVETGVVRINTGEVKQVEITQADGEILSLTKTGKTEQGHDRFTIGGLPEGVAPKDEQAVRYAATDLANIDFIDVRKAKAGGVPSSRAMLETDKGLKVAYGLFTGEDSNWLRVAVESAGEDDERAERLTKATTGWEFAIADYKAKQFQKRLSDLLDMQQ